MVTKHPRTVSFDKESAKIWDSLPKGQKSYILQLAIKKFAAEELSKVNIEKPSKRSDRQRVFETLG